MFTKPRPQYNKSAARLSQQIAEEAQLLAEEKWIIDALKKIKLQRNGLQIERLHLESMQAKRKARKEQPSNVNAVKDQKVDNPTSAIVIQAEEIPRHRNPFDNIKLDTRDLENEDCNSQELNLSVTDSVLSSHPYGICEDEEEEEDFDNCVLDIDLLMSSK